MQVILAVDDVERSVDFYERAFGWPRNPRIDYSNYVELLEPTGGCLGLFERGAFARTAGAETPAKPERQTATELYVRVDDVEPVIDRLEELGARQLAPLAPREWGEEAAYYADPDGNVVAVARRLT
jgi:catechol 2,3-dioxygenase-like lactoylglutathione lyase family enzyme